MVKIIWALFDSGGGSYQQTVTKYFNDKCEVYPIGIDIEGKRENFIYCDLADISEYFGKSKMFDILDKLPKPDIILASPPCESWSMASAIKGGGNNCWRNVGNESILRTKPELDTINATGTPFRRIFHKTVYNRLNGEACAYNLIRIIERYKPKHWVIENPQTSKLWSYYEEVCDFHGIKNVAHYLAYSEEFPKKATTFYSNVKLNLKTTKKKATIGIRKRPEHKQVGRGELRNDKDDYNARSPIPLELIKDILEQLFKQGEKKI